MNDPSTRPGTTGDEADRRMLARLAAALGPDEPPAGLVDRAAGLLPWRDVTADLAVELTAGHDAMDPEPAGVRGSGGAVDPAVTVFGVPDGSLTVEVSTSTPGELTGVLHLAGHVLAVRLESRAGDVLDAVVDDLGTFTVRGVPGGPVRLWVETPERRTCTSWFLS